MPKRLNVLQEHDASVYSGEATNSYAYTHFYGVYQRNNQQPYACSYGSRNLCTIIIYQKH